MGHPALDYAEHILGLHTVYNEAENLGAQLDTRLTELDQAQDAKRDLELRITDREMEIFFNERSQHTDKSATALDQHVKLERHRDPELTTLRMKLNGAKSDVSGLEYDVDSIKHRLRTAQARMEQMGGFFNYLAAVKSAEIAKTANNVTPAKEN